MKVTDVLRSRLLLLGAAVLLVSLFLRWYSDTLAGESLPTRTGWEALGRLDIYLAVLAVVCIAYAPLTTRRRALAEPLQLGLTAGATLALALVVYRIASPPGGAKSGFVTEASVSFGPFVALVGVVLVLAVARPSDSEAMPLRR